MQAFKNLKVRTKLLFAFGILLFINLIAGASILNRTDVIHDDLRYIAEERYFIVTRLDDLSYRVASIGSDLREMLLEGDARKHEVYFARMGEHAKVALTIFDDLEKMARTAEEKELQKELLAARTAYAQERDKFFALLNEKKRADAHKFLLGPLAKAELTYQNMIRKNTAFQRKQADEAVARAGVTFRAAVGVLIGVGALSVLAIVFLIFLLSRTIISPLRNCLAVAGRMSHGDLTENEGTTGVATRDETGELLTAMQEMRTKWRATLLDLKGAADTVASASQELSAQAEQMSAGVSEQSGRASQIATATTEMSQTVIDVAKNASSIAANAGDTAGIAKKGDQVVSLAVTEVKAIAETVSASVGLMSSLGERSQQIGDIIRVIKDIADQTNLLALNAAIEAARAGEQGRGFAVVADEVRKLAERTARATSEIGSMIGAIQGEVQQAVVSMNEGARRVETGVNYSANAGGVLKDIVMGVEDLLSMVQRIAAATEEMSSVAEQISGDVETVAQVSKETAAGSGEIAQSSSNLAKVAGSLTELVARFRV